MHLPSGTIRRRVTGDRCDRFRYEKALSRSGFSTVAGIDEAGRGACAGPLAVGAVVLDVTARRTQTALAELNDSKKLTAAARERVFDRIVHVARSWAVVVIPPAEVDGLGLHVANLQGMRRALARLDVEADYALTDGFGVSGLAVPNLGIWKGDEVCACVSAAGVIAKVTRDRIMMDLDSQYPAYGFGIHKGYLTAAHRRALRDNGPSPVHRRCFAPVRSAIDLSVRDTFVDSGTSSEEGAA